MTCQQVGYDQLGLVTRPVITALFYLFIATQELKKYHTPCKHVQIGLSVFSLGSIYTRYTRCTYHLPTEYSKDPNYWLSWAAPIMLRLCVAVETSNTTTAENGLQGLWLTNPYNAEIVTQTGHLEGRITSGCARVRQCLYQVQSVGNVIYWCKSVLTCVSLCLQEHFVTKSLQEIVINVFLEKLCWDLIMHRILPIIIFAIKHQGKEKNMPYSRKYTEHQVTWGEVKWGLTLQNYFSHSIHMCVWVYGCFLLFQSYAGFAVPAHS